MTRGAGTRQPLFLLAVALGALVLTAAVAACGEAESPLAYTNEEYGFTLQFPESWKGYKAHSEPFPASLTAGLEPSANIQFDLPGTTSMFVIQVWDADVWQQFQAQGTIIPDVLARRDVLVFTGLIAVSVPEGGQALSEEELQSRLAEVPAIIQSFELH